jgi:hypothetical protein
MAMSPTVPTILSAVSLVVRTAMNSGSPGNVLTVHTRRRFWRDSAKFASLFKRQSPDLLPGRINGWLLYRGSTRPEEAEERWRFYSLHRIVLDGYMGVNDADGSSDQAAFVTQIEAIRDGLRLSTAVFGNTERTLPDVEVEEDASPVTIGDVTCWYARLSLEVEASEVKSL